VLDFNIAFFKTLEIGGNRMCVLIDDLNYVNWFGRLLEFPGVNMAFWRNCEIGDNRIVK